MCVCGQRARTGRTHAAGHPRECWDRYRSREYRSHGSQPSVERLSDTGNLCRSWDQSVLGQISFSKTLCSIFRYSPLAVGMDFEEIFRSTDIRPCHASLRRVRCLHTGPFTGASRSGRSLKTCAIASPRPVDANGRRHSCASRPACRPLPRPARACGVRAIRKPSLAGGIAGTPRASSASPSGTDAGARPLVPPDRHDPETAAPEVEHLVRRDPRPCGLTQTRGTLDAIHSQLAWGRDAALRGIARILGRLGITWQCACRRGHSPDPHEPANLQESADVAANARAPQPGGDRGFG